jgi:AAA+ ATPase superfamily predicted ATPase
MSRFVGRQKELKILRGELKAVRADRGRLVAMRGRRRVGKSSLVQRFVEESVSCPHVFFSAPRHEPRARALAKFVAAIAESDLPVADIAVDGTSFGSWDAALRFAAQQATAEQPVIVVIDELPYILESDPAAGAELQHCWDRYLSDQPVLLILIGSDIGMMERVTGHDGELYGRPTREPRIDPLSPGETAMLVGLDDPGEAIDAYLVCGGFPVLADDWELGTSVEDYLAGQLQDDNNLLVMHGQRILDAEFADDVSARSVLEAVGSGERTFSNIQRHLSINAATTVTRALERLVFKHVIEVPQRLDGKGWDGERRYYIADVYLRFWLRFVGPYVAEITRGQGGRTHERIRRDFASYRGKAVEPIVHAALRRIDGPWPATVEFGGFWTRSNNPEVDIVGVDTMPNPKGVTLVGSIKWRENKPYTSADTRALLAVKDKIPGVSDETELIGVSRRGFTDGHGLDYTVEATEILAA